MFEFIINGLVMVSFVVALYCLYGYVKERKFKFSWWKWILCSAWLLGMFLIFAFIGTAVGEGEPGAAMRGGIAFLIIVALSGAAVFAICFPRSLRNSEKSNGGETS